MSKPKAKLFNDGFYKTIMVEPMLLMFIDTPQFQRLRDIKQLGFGSFVYPSANHTRFEHSIGTAYLAGELLKHLSDRNPEVFRSVSHKDIQCVKLAGLLHDLGHGPFSHTWEMAINETQKDNVFHHEDVSVAMIDYLIAENFSSLEETGLDEDDVLFVKELINPRNSKTSSRGGRKELHFLYQIISNSETGCDVDKWDYLNRDAFHAGVETSFDYKRLIFNAEVVEHEGVTHVAFRDNAVPNLIQMFETRRAMHQQVYQHRVAKQIERLFVQAIAKSADQFTTRSLKDPSVRLPLLSAHTRMDVFMGLDDSILQRLFLDGPEAARALIGDIRNRKLGHLIDECFVNHENLQKLEYKRLEREFLRKVRDSGEKCCVWFSTQKTDFGMKDKNPLSDVVLFSKEGKTFYMSENAEYIEHVTPRKIQEHKLVVYADEKPRDLNRVRDILTKFMKSKSISLVASSPASSKRRLEFSNEHSAFNRSEEEHGAKRASKNQ